MADSTTFFRVSGARFIFRVEGADKIARAFEGLPRAVVAHATRTVLRRALGHTFRAAKRMVPVQSGNLARGLKLRAAPRRRGDIGMMVTSSAIDFTGDDWYGGPVHWGHYIGRRATNVDIGLRARKRRTLLEKWQIQTRNLARKFVPGHPFITDAVDETSDQVMYETGRLLGREIDALYSMEVGR